MTVALLRVFLRVLLGTGFMDPPRPSGPLCRLSVCRHKVIPDHPAASTILANESLPFVLSLSIHIELEYFFGRVIQNFLRLWPNLGVGSLRAIILSDPVSECDVVVPTSSATDKPFVPICCALNPSAGLCTRSRSCTKKDNP